MYLASQFYNNCFIFYGNRDSCDIHKLLLVFSTAHVVVAQGNRDLRNWFIGNYIYLQSGLKPILKESINCEIESIQRTRFI